MNTLTISSLFCAFVALTFASVVAFKSTKEKQYRWFAILCFTIALWNLFFFFAHTFNSILLERVHLLLTLALALCSAYFFLQVIDQSKNFTLIYILGFLVAMGIILPPEKLWIFKHTSYLYAVAIVSYTFFFLTQHLRHAKLGIQEQKRQIYLVLGGVGTLLMLIFDQLSEAGFPFPAIGNVVLIIYLYFIYQTITKRKILDLEDLVAKGVLFSILAGILTLVYVILVSWVEGPALFLFNTFVASFVILILFESIKTLAEKITTQFFLKTRIKIEEKLENLQNSLIGVSDLRDLVDTILIGLKDSLKATQAHFFLLDPEGIKFKLIQSLEPDPSKTKITEVPISHDFIKYSQKRYPQPVSTYLINREIVEGGSNTPKEKLKNTLQLFDTFPAECALPFMLEGKMLGFCTFINDKSDIAYPLNELKLLTPLSRQIAQGLKNLEIYDKIRERDRLATLGEMSAGLAHEIRNPLGAIKGAAQYLQPTMENMTQNEFLKIIVDEVDRLNTVVTQFLNYAKPFQQNLSETNIDELLKKTLQTATSDFPSNIKLTYHADSQTPLLAIDPQQINQVFLNLTRNAIQAMPQGGELKVALKSSKESIQIIFEDTGVGIPPENIKNLFIPFFTTKEEGSGLGLPICQKIIKAHGGTIQIESILQKGTKFIITLPSKKS